LNQPDAIYLIETLPLSTICWCHILHCQVLPEPVQSASQPTLAMEWLTQLTYPALSYVLSLTSCQSWPSFPEFGSNECIEYGPIKHMFFSKKHCKNNGHMHTF